MEADQTQKGTDFLTKGKKGVNMRSDANLDSPVADSARPDWPNIRYDGNEKERNNRTLYR
jgi:hypothetical protein